MRAMRLMGSQQLCMLAFVVDGCSTAMNACFAIGDYPAAKHICFAHGDYSAAKHAYFVTYH